MLLLQVYILKRKCPGSMEKLNLDLDSRIKPTRWRYSATPKCTKGILEAITFLFLHIYSLLNIQTYFSRCIIPPSKLLPKSLPSWLFISLNSTTILTQLKPLWEKDICTRANMQNGKLKSHFSCNLLYKRPCTLWTSRVRNEKEMVGPPKNSGE